MTYVNPRTVSVKAQTIPLGMNASIQDCHRSCRHPAMTHVRSCSLACVCCSRWRFPRRARVYGRQSHASMKLPHAVRADKRRVLAFSHSRAYPTGWLFVVGVNVLPVDMRSLSHVRRAVGSSLTSCVINRHAFVRSRAIFGGLPFRRVSVGLATVSLSRAIHLPWRIVFDSCPRLRARRFNFRGSMMTIRFPQHL